MAQRARHACVVGWITGGSGIVHGIASLVAMFFTDPVVIVRLLAWSAVRHLAEDRWTWVAAAVVFTVYTGIGIFAILEIEHAASGLSAASVTAAEPVPQEPGPLSRAPSEPRCGLLASLD